MRIVFDLGAVLLRWRPEVVLARCLPPPLDLAAAKAAVFQGYGGDWGEYDLGRIEPDALAQRLHARTGYPVAALRALINAVPEELLPQPAVLALLLQLKAQGQRLSFLSNMPAPCADALEARWPFTQWFESGVFSSRVHVSKPDLRIFDLAAAHFGSEPADCLLIDDHPANVQAAREAGWHAHLFVDAPTLLRELRSRQLLR